MDNESGIVSGIVLIAKNIIKENSASLPALGQLVASGAVSGIDYLANGSDFIVNAVRDVLRFIEDGVFACPASTAAAARVDAKVPVWRYRFFHKFDNLLLGGQGAFHVGDVPIVMGTSERKIGAKNVDEQTLLIKNVMTAWATFAKDPEEGLTKLGWPKYDPNSESC
jgi:carboxylesterase type B